MEDILNGESQVTRRDFLKGAGIVGVGAAVAGLSSACGVKNEQEEELVGDPDGIFVDSKPASFTVNQEYLYTIKDNRYYNSILEGGLLDFPGVESDLVAHYSEDVFSSIGFAYMPEADGKERNGQVSPSLYSVPKEMYQKTLKLTAFVFDTPQSSKEYMLDSQKKYFMMPVVCEGDPQVSLVPKRLDKDGKPIPQEKIDSNGDVLDREKRQKGFDILPTDRGMKYDRGHWGMYLTEVVNNNGKMEINFLGILDGRHIYFHPDALSQDMKNVEYNNSNMKVGQE